MTSTACTAHQNSSRFGIPSIYPHGYYYIPWGVWYYLFVRNSLSTLAGLLKRFWILAMVMVALIAAASVVGRLRTFFDLDKPYTEASLPADAITPINTKRVTYQIFGPSDASGRISYLDVNGKTIEAGFTSLPWSVTVSTTDPGVLANVVAQGDTPTLGCRILVNDRLVVENVAEGRDAQAFCLDKAA